MKQSNSVIVKWKIKPRAFIYGYFGAYVIFRLMVGLVEWLIG
jgi:hypothetical protein